MSSTASPFTGCGREAGVKVWRVKDFNLVEEKDVGSFYSGMWASLVVCNHHGGDRGSRCQLLTIERLRELRWSPASMSIMYKRSASM